MKKVFMSISLLLVLIAPVVMVGCGNSISIGDIPNGRYEFHNISFGNSIVDKNDTVEAIKGKLTAEFPERDWEINAMAENVFAWTTATDFFNINGNRWDYNMTHRHGIGSLRNTARNERYRLVDSEIEARRRLGATWFDLLTLRATWVPQDLYYGNETIHFNWSIYTVNFQK